MIVLDFQISADDLLCAGKGYFNTGRGECSHAQSIGPSVGRRRVRGMPLKRGIVGSGVKGQDRKAAPPDDEQEEEKDG